MANEEHLAMLRQGFDVWNAWRDANPDVVPDLEQTNLQTAYLNGVNLSRANLNSVDLSRANLGAADLSMADLVSADLRETYLREAYCSGANLSQANLSNAVLSGTNLRNVNLYAADLLKANLNRADLRRANLSRADLRAADLSWADLSEADLGEAKLGAADLSSAILHAVNFSGAVIALTTFGNNDLSKIIGLDTVHHGGGRDLNPYEHYCSRKIIGLDTVHHGGPSTIGIDTLYHSSGKIPKVFLRGCGVPDSLIEYLPSLIGAMEPIQFYSCFISYSHKDEDFAQRLYERMQRHHLRVWYAPEDMKGGAKLHEQIDQAIRIHDKLVLVLSEQSIQSEWVMTEIRKARKAELRDNRRKLFPIRLVDFDAIRDWECFDADSGKDLAVEVREYFIPDFTRWKDHDAFERAFTRFLNDLQATETRPIPRPAEPSKSSAQQKTTPQNPQTVIVHKKRRLEKLEEQAAIKGISTPPEVLTEIDDLRREIDELEGDG